MYIVASDQLKVKCIIQVWDRILDAVADHFVVHIVGIFDSLGEPGRSSTVRPPHVHVRQRVSNLHAQIFTRIMTFTNVQSFSAALWTIVREMNFIIITHDDHGGEILVDQTSVLFAEVTHQDGYRIGIPALVQSHGTERRLDDDARLARALSSVNVEQGFASGQAGRVLECFTLNAATDGTHHIAAHRVVNRNCHHIVLRIESYVEVFHSVLVEPPALHVALGFRKSPKVSLHFPPILGSLGMPILPEGLLRVDHFLKLLQHFFVGALSPQDYTLSFDIIHVGHPLDQLRQVPRACTRWIITNEQTFSLAYGKARSITIAMKRTVRKIDSVSF